MRLRSLFLCTFLLAARAAPVLAAPGVPLAAFVYEDQFSRPRLAPDGKHLALTVRVPDGDRFVPVVMVYSVPEMQTTGAIRMPAFEVPLDYRWLSTTRLAIAKGKELGSREKPVPTGEVLAAELDGSKQEYLYGYRMRLFSSRGDRYGNDEGFGYVEDIPRSHNSRLFLTAHPWEGSHSMLYDVDSRSAVRTLVADLSAPDLGFVIQNSGQPRYAYGADENAEVLLMRYDDAGKRWQKAGGQLGRRYVPLVFSADDRALYVTYSEDGGPDQLIREDIASGKRTILFADKAGSFSDVMFASNLGEPFGAHSAVGRPRAVYFDEKSEEARLHKTLSAQFPDHYLHFVDFSDDGGVLLFGVSSDRDPGSYYLLDRKTMKANLLFSSLETIDPDRMAPRRPVAFHARDGLELHGYLTMPAHAPGVKPPLVLMPHGGPFGISDGWFYDNDAQFLASRGYAVLQVNFRGSGGRGPDFKEAGYREWGGKIQDDLVDGVRWTVAQGEVDGTRMCVYGASFGGYSALMLAAREPSLFKCAVGYLGVYDLNLLARPENNRLDAYRAAYIGKTVGAGKAELDKASPVALAARITVPVLLVHGGKDKRAPVEHAEAMRAALVKAGHPPEWFLAPNEGHGFYDTKNVTEFYQRLESFLGKHLGQ
ncbi:alpha/beta hydrolase family protein [Massilia aerilata]|uniref:Alpha/beta hydrolase family protein n=1 Tax=Massilia aerilata TaxID=453817 RepID=A0ABW0RZ63_9BURK